MTLQIIFETLAGSHLYGMATPTSDKDFRGVAFEPMEAILGLKTFEQEVSNSGTDRTVYGLKKFVNLALENNPNIVELLYAPLNGPTCITVTNTWKIIHNLRTSFLSKKINQNFGAYAHSQIKKMETHHRWMVMEPPTKPIADNYGREVGSDGFEIWTDYSLKQKYDADLKHYQQYETWVKNRNPVRFELEKKYGFDTKDGSHIFRLFDQGIELVKTKNLTLPRPDAKILLGIRNGSMDYETLLKVAAEKEQELDALAEKSDLPETGDYKTINKTIMEIYYNYVVDEL